MATSLDLNEALGTFLGPMGLVYAIFFGYTYQKARDKFTNMCLMFSSEMVLKHPCCCFRK